MVTPEHKYVTSNGVVYTKPQAWRKHQRKLWCEKLLGDKLTPVCSLDQDDSVDTKLYEALYDIFDVTDSYNGLRRIGVFVYRPDDATTHVYAQHALGLSYHIADRFLWGHCVPGDVYYLLVHYWANGDVHDVVPKTAAAVLKKAETAYNAFGVLLGYVDLAATKQMP